MVKVENDDVKFEERKKKMKKIDQETDTSTHYYPTVRIAFKIEYTMKKRDVDDKKLIPTFREYVVDDVVVTPYVFRLFQDPLLKRNGKHKDEIIGKSLKNLKYGIREDLGKSSILLAKGIGAYDFYNFSNKMPLVHEVYRFDHGEKLNKDELKELEGLLKKNNFMHEVLSLPKDGVYGFETVKEGEKGVCFYTAMGLEQILHGVSKFNPNIKTPEKLLELASMNSETANEIADKASVALAKYAGLLQDAIDEHSLKSHEESRKEYKQDEEYNLYRDLY